MKWLPDMSVETRLWFVCVANIVFFCACVVPSHFAVQDMRAAVEKLHVSGVSDSVASQAGASHEAQQDLESSSARAYQCTLFALGVGLVACVGSLLTTGVVNSSILAPLRDFAAIVQRVAEGDLTVRIQPRSDNDALGKGLAALVNNLADVTAQMSESTTVLRTSVQEIMAAISESATGATQTAAAVSQASTTAEEVRKTSHAISQKVAQVSEASTKSLETAEAGTDATRDTIAGMNRIREQMDLIAESMVRLSEKNQSIVEIIAVVDDLAQQSNLLAVNASIEAAKAGDQGKGFAVVAQEVKSMAEQSKQATAQVRTILSEIQRATNAAAMATELGSKTVDSAVVQSNQAGQSIETLAESVNDFAKSANMIVVSLEQEAMGVDQVATSMVGIREAVSQNLVAVRQVEEAARSLSELGDILKSLTDRYHL
jgi:methyl-accepting chemotaxis protein